MTSGGARGEPIAQALAGGSPRSLGRTGEVIDRVLGAPEQLDELFVCLFDADEVVRMRAADALEKVCREQPGRLEPYVGRLLDEVSKIDQPSVRWHLAQMLAETDLTGAERDRAVAILMGNLNQSDDWIVINCTLDSLAAFARAGWITRRRITSALRRFEGDRRKSVASRARRLLAEFSE
ncbi:MAG TPA: hypothetical protein VKG38_02500 [Solirubrobacteraceae bacterium]|nr:hypothetical protein [Solirubrobacteraceae bacterium]